MSGAIVLRSLLASNAALIAVVPAAKIMAGVIPLNTVLPAISIAQISGVDFKTISTTGTKLVTDRVQVTVMATTYALQKSILALVKTACASQRATINGIVVDSILKDGEGPDIFDSELTIYFQSQDFLVNFYR